MLDLLLEINLIVNRSESSLFFTEWEVLMIKIYISLHIYGEGYYH